jgi:hypothetical protein
MNSIIALLVTAMNSTFAFAANSSQIIFDELSPWHSPGNSGVAYDSFEPLRVRREGVDFFFRTDARKAFNGIRYGEIRLRSPQGSLLYLPRELDLKDAISLRFYIRKTNPNSTINISLFQSADRQASFPEESLNLRIQPDGEWYEATIPLASISYQKFHNNLPANPMFRESEVFLNWHKSSPGKLWGIRLNINNGKKGDSLFIDRLIIVRNKTPSTRSLQGYLEPAIPGARVIVTSDKGIATTQVGKSGEFSITLPPNSTMAEIIAETDKMVFTPIQGRFMEFGEYLPPLLIKTSESGITKSQIKGNMNSSRYFYEDRAGPRFEPLLHFGIGVEENNKQLVLAELFSNSLGYIDQDHPIDGSSDVYRVLWLGECHQMGVHVAQSDSWWIQTEAMLTITTKRPVEIISASFHYSPFVNAWPAYKNLTKKYRPNLVILPIIDPEVLNLNVEEYIMEWLSASKGHLPTYQFSLGSNGKVVHKTYDSDWQLYREQMSEQMKKAIRKKYYSWEYVREDRKSTPQWVLKNLSGIEAALREFANDSKQMGTRVIVLYISDFHLKSNREENGIKYTPKPFLDDMRAMTKRAGLEFVDLSPNIHRVMAGDDTDRIYFKGNGHWTPYGHFRAGKALSNYLAIQANKK